MAVCPILLPKEFDVDAENVSGGHTVEYYGVIVGGVFTISSTILSLGLAFIHATHYSKPEEQKHIIRVLFMVPVYTLLSSISTLSYTASLYMQPLQQFYEAIALASIFNLFFNYVRPTFGSQLDCFYDGTRTIRRQAVEDQYAMDRPKKSTRWFKIMMMAVYQYLILGGLTSILTMITTAANVYCEASTAPQFAHIWLYVFQLVGLTTCMIGIVYFYKGLKPLLLVHKPVLKVLCIKIIVILNAVQPELFKILLSKGAIGMSKQWTYGDITVMIPSALISIECFIISIVFFWAFNPREYFISNRSMSSTVMEYGDTGLNKSYSGGPLGLVALFQASFMWDLITNTARIFAFVPSVFRKQTNGAALKDHNERRSSYRKMRNQSLSDTASTQIDHSPDGHPLPRSEEPGPQLEPLSQPYQHHAL